MRLIHTADIHLDTCYASARVPPPFGNRRRQSLREVFHAIIERAGEWPADALLIAGDLFDLERVTRDTVRFLQAEFASIQHVPICIASGNQDPCVPGSPYAEETWPNNVTIFGQPEWRSLTLDEQGTTVHGFGFNSTDSSADPFAGFPPLQLGPTHVAVLHGTALGYPLPIKHCRAPFDPAAASGEGLRYIALGHAHRFMRIGGDDPTCMAYPGAPEGHGFHETGMHYFLEVEIGAEGVQISPVPSARSVYLTESIDCSAFRSSREVVDAILAVPREENVQTIAHITLTGSGPLEWRAEMDAVYDATAAAFEHLVLDDQTAPANDDAALAGQDTSLGAFVAHLNAELADADGDREREMLARARALGLAAYRNQPMVLQGLERDSA